MIIGLLLLISSTLAFNSDWQQGKFFDNWKGRNADTSTSTKFDRSIASSRCTFCSSFLLYKFRETGSCAAGQPTTSTKDAKLVIQGSSVGFSTCELNAFEDCTELCSTYCRSWVRTTTILHRTVTEKERCSTYSYDIALDYIGPGIAHEFNQPYSRQCAEFFTRAGSWGSVIHDVSKLKTTLDEKEAKNICSKFLDSCKDEQAKQDKSKSCAESNRVSKDLENDEKNDTDDDDDQDDDDDNDNNNILSLLIPGDGLSSISFGGGTDARFPDNVLDISKATRSQANHDSCKLKILQKTNGPHHKCSLALWTSIIQLDKRADDVLKRYNLYQKSSLELLKLDTNDMKNMLNELLICGIILIRTLSDEIRHKKTNDFLNLDQTNQKEKFPGAEFKIEVSDYICLDLLNSFNFFFDFFFDLLFLYLRFFF